MFIDSAFLSSPAPANLDHESGLNVLRHRWRGARDAVLPPGRADEAAIMLQFGQADARGKPRLGRDASAVYLSACRYSEALQLLFNLLRDDPRDADTLLRLGDCYLAGGSAAAADQFYRCAQGLLPESPEVITRRMLAAESMPGRPEPWLAESGFPLDPSAIGDLLEELSGSARHAPDAADLQSAVSLLEEVLRAPDPATLVRARLSEVLERLPALIAFTASQTDAEGDAERARALAQLAKRAII